jgi:hypothetical protein
VQVALVRTLGHAERVAKLYTIEAVRGPVTDLLSGFKSQGEAAEAAPSAFGVYLRTKGPQFPNGECVFESRTNAVCAKNAAWTPATFRT